MKIPAFPTAFPIANDITVSNTALLVIDMQIDFCAEHGYIDRMGVDLTPLRRPIEPIKALLGLARSMNLLVVHTRETFQPDLSDVQPHRLYRGAPGDAVVPGDAGPLGRALIEGEACWDIIAELAPLAHEAIFNKRAYGAFGCTDIDAHLQAHQIKNLILTGVTTDCCIQSNLREALDRGYECLVVEDGCGASRADTHDRSIALMKHNYAVFGCVTDCAALMRTLGAIESAGS